MCFPISQIIRSAANLKTCRKLLKTVQTTTFRNPLADPLGTHRRPPLVRGPEPSLKTAVLSGETLHVCYAWLLISGQSSYISFLSAIESVFLQCCIIGCVCNKLTGVMIILHYIIGGIPVVAHWPVYNELRCLDGCVNRLPIITAAATLYIRVYSAYNISHLSRPGCYLYPHPSTACDNMTYSDCLRCLGLL